MNLDLTLMRCIRSSSPAESITTEISYTSEVMESLRKNTPSMPAALKNTATALNDDDALVAEKFSSSMTTSKEDTIIPSAHAIHAAKKKREQLRKGIIQETTEDDFIALDDVSALTIIMSGCCPNTHCFRVVQRIFTTGA